MYKRISGLSGYVEYTSKIIIQSVRIVMLIAGVIMIVHGLVAEGSASQTPEVNSAISDANWRI